jgi:hypothetical protein
MAIETPTKTDGRKGKVPPGVGPDTGKGTPGQSDTQPRETKPKKSKTAQKIIGYGLGGLMALEGIGATVTELTNDKPFSITQTLPEDLLHPYRLGLKNVELVSTKFDNNLDKQTIRAGINATPISREELSALLTDTVKPVETGQFPNISIIMPVELSNDQAVEESTLYYSQTFNPVTERVEASLPTGKRFLIPNKGTKIIVPVDGAEIFLRTSYEVKGQSYFDGIMIQFDGPDGTRYSISICSPDDVRQLLPMDIIKEAKEQKAGVKGIPVPAGTPVLITNMDNTNIQINLSFSSPQYSRPGLCGFNLITNDQGQEVLYVSSDANN